jgi:hypothetical protein
MASGQVKEKHRLFSPMDNMELRADRRGMRQKKEGRLLWRVK